MVDVKCSTIVVDLANVHALFIKKICSTLYLTFHSVLCLELKAYNSTIQYPPLPF